MRLFHKLNRRNIKLNLLELLFHIIIGGNCVFLNNK